MVIAFKLDPITENEEPNLNYSTSSNVIVEELKKSANEIIKICNHNECNRKLKLTDYECKCKKTYCKFHRKPEEHNCEYDYRDNCNKEEKIKNMKCISIKLQKII